MKYILSIDIGGTTFNTGIFSDALDQIYISPKDKIRNYTTKGKIVDAMLCQINDSINNSLINKSDLLGIGIASPGPLDNKKGVILDTPNLSMFRNFNIAKYFSEKLNLKTFLENDANLFALGEWYTSFKKSKVFVGVTLGTGFGLGLVSNGILFVGSNGKAMEYGSSIFPWGKCEKNISIKYIRSKSIELYGKELSPRIVEKDFYKNDRRAVTIYNKYGENLGIVLSHVINMLDPEIVCIGGGLSNAFDCYKNSMLKSIKKHSLSFNMNTTSIVSSDLRKNSSLLGASLLVKNHINNNGIY